MNKPTCVLNLVWELYSSTMMKSIWILLFFLMLPIGGFTAATPAIVWESGYVQPTRPRKASGAVRVLFWNSGYNGLPFGQKGPAQTITLLERNMLGLVGSQWAPDIVVFSECKPVLFSEEFQRRWIATFPPVILVPYNSFTAGVGICIFSKFPLDQPILNAPLDWRPNNLSLKDLAAYEELWNTIPDLQTSKRVPWGYRFMFERPFTSSVFRTPRGSVRLLPVHLVNSWSKYSIEYPRTGFARTIRALKRGSNAPTYNQLRNLLSIARQSVAGPKLSTLMLGDFNLPGTWSYGYRGILQGGWQETFPASMSKTATFPVPSSRGSTAKVLGVPVSISMKIDHSFKAPGTDATSVVLPLSGSDHFPVWTVVVP